MLAQKPLIQYTIDAAKTSRLDELIVSTDSDEIAAVGNELGANVPFKRPAALATDSAKSIDVAKHSLLTCEEKYRVEFDAIMLLQPTAPFRSTADIDEAIKIVESDPAIDSVISVVDVDAYHPARMKFIENGRLVDPPFCEAHENQNRQELTPMYIRNGAIYLTKKNILLQNSYKGKNCMALVMPSERSVNIDTLKDFDYAEWVLSKYLR